MTASVEELAAALAKDPDAKKAELDTERSFAKALFAELHKPPSGDLFGIEKQAPVLEPSAATVDYLKKHDDLPSKSEEAWKENRKAVASSDIADLVAANEDQLLDCLLEGTIVAPVLYMNIFILRLAATLWEN